MTGGSRPASLALEPGNEKLGEDRLSETKDVLNSVVAELILDQNVGVFGSLKIRSALNITNRD